MLRPLEFIEKAFVTPGSSEFVELAVKFSDPKFIPKALENFKKIFYGQKLKVINNAFYKAPGDTKVARLPSWVTDCPTACQWIYDNHHKPIEETLCTIAANDSIVVVNSNHNAADSSFLIRAMDRCLDDDVGEIPEVPYVMSKAYKEQIEEGMRTAPEIYSYKVCTHFTFDTTDPALMPKGTLVSYIKDEFPASQLQCYDHKKKRPVNLSAVLFTSVALACSSFEKVLPPRFALPFVIDLKRFLKDPSKVDWSYNNHVSTPNIHYEISPNITINEAYQRFLENLKQQEKDGSYFKATKMEYYSADTNKIFGNLSNIGPIRFKKPITDFYIKSTNDGVGVDNQICLLTYSRVNETNNILTNQVRYTKSTVTQKTANIFNDMLRHIMTKIPQDTKLGDAFKELREFQTILQKEY